MSDLPEITLEINGPVQWCCPLCGRLTTGHWCPNGHGIPEPAGELLDLVKFLAGAVHEPWVAGYVKDKLTEIFGEEP